MLDNKCYITNQFLSLWYYVAFHIFHYVSLVRLSNVANNSLELKGFRSEDKEQYILKETKE